MVVQTVVFSIEGEENGHEVDSGDGSHQMEADYMEADVIDLQGIDQEIQPLLAKVSFMKSIIDECAYHDSFIVCCRRR
jgi:hypothetical protein